MTVGLWLLVVLMNTEFGQQTKFDLKQYEFHSEAACLEAKRRLVLAFGMDAAGKGTLMRGAACILTREGVLWNQSGEK